jgi:hypothetical protein
MRQPFIDETLADAARRRARREVLDAYGVEALGDMPNEARDRPRRQQLRPESEPRRRRGPADESAELRAALRSILERPVTRRQAILLAEILGPPKALQRD